MSSDCSDRDGCTTTPIRCHIVSKMRSGCVVMIVRKILIEMIDLIVMNVRIEVVVTGVPTVSNR